MSSVTARIKAVKQPRGGYIKPFMFESIHFSDGKFLFSDENVHASIIGMVVDYMARFSMTSDVNDTFAISKRGVSNPRLNVAYVLDVKKIPSDVIAAVEHDVICY